MLFIYGLLVGLLISTIVEIVTLYVLLRNRPTIDAIIKRIEVKARTKQPISIIKRKSEAEEAYSHILEVNKDRGGIPDSELK